MTIAEDAAAILRGIRDGEPFAATSRALYLTGVMTAVGLLEVADPDPLRVKRPIVQLTDIYFVRVTDKGLEALEHPETLEFGLDIECAAYSLDHEDTVAVP
jgi:hypothetical protein